MKKLFWLLAVTAGCLAGSASAHTGDHAFLSVDYSQNEDKASLEQHELLTEIQKVANNLSKFESADGRVLLPEGTVCSNVDLTDQVLTISFTLPSSASKGTLDIMTSENIGAVIREHFWAGGVYDVLNLEVRAGASKSYESLDNFISQPVISGLDNDDFYEANGPGPQPSPDYSTLYNDSSTLKVAGQHGIASSGMPTGGLAGRTVYIGAGHGWTYTGSSWALQRPRIERMNEDYGNIDQVTIFADYLFNAGATVVPMRPVGFQDNEVVLDSGDASFSGSWSNSVNPSFYIGGQNYRFASAAATETATATYTPNIPESGLYPVYCWTLQGSDRISGQLYRIRHRGGEHEVRINHRRVGRGWVYLGSYYFDAGISTSNGSVVISNLQPPSGTQTGVVIADAIRFGNGIGDVDRGGGVSTYDRQGEASRYWVQRSVAADAGTSIFDTGGSDGSDNVGTPPRMAAAMRRDDGQGYEGDIYLGYHSNAFNGSARGSVALITNSGGTPANQATFAALTSDILDADALIEDANWENSWVDRPSSTLTSAYGEISNSNLNGEMSGTIIEIAFHDSTDDAELLRDPKVRIVAARAMYKAIVEYFNQFDSGSDVYLPEPPVRVAVEGTGTNSATISWEPGPSTGASGAAATSYRVYRSDDGYAFDSGVAAGSTSLTVNDLTPGQPTYFRVTGVNTGGESMPSEVIAVYPSASTEVLIVNGYDRIDRFNNVVEFPSLSFDAQTERLQLSLNNAYNYVIEHADAIAASSTPMDSCSNEAVINGDITLTDYEVVVWIFGEESTSDSTFSSTEQTLVTTYLNDGNSLFFSGAEVGWDLDGSSSASTGDTSFLNNVLNISYEGDDSTVYTATGESGNIFAGLSVDFIPNDVRNYDADFPDLLGSSNGSNIIMRYDVSGTNGAAISYQGGFPERRIIALGFPFELINSESTRESMMTSSLNFLNGSTANLDGWLLFE